ncbi:MAG: VanZ family protein [Bacilli bacterium]
MNNFKATRRFICSIIISLISYHFFMKDLFNDLISVSIDIHMILFLCSSYIIYIVIYLILDRKVGSKEIHTLKFMYTIFLITLFFSKDINTDIGYIKMFNLNVMGILYSFESNNGILFFVMNIVLIIPIGFMYRKFNSILKFLFPLLLFVVIEYVQYTSGVGVFDINDIILNTLGFYIGTFIFSKVK